MSKGLTVLVYRMSEDLRRLCGRAWYMHQNIYEGSFVHSLELLPDNRMQPEILLSQVYGRR